jgi:transcriptional regulator with XRE-family HTH domain
MDTRAELARFGQKIRQAREREVISVAELAARTGVDVRKITALEAGRFDPPFDVMSALADGIGVPLYALMPDDGAKRQAT